MKFVVVEVDDAAGVPREVERHDVTGWSSSGVAQLVHRIQRQYRDNANIVSVVAGASV